MKEARYFYVPDVGAGRLPDEEASHALRVLRLRPGDEIFLIDGVGAFHRAVVSLAASHHCGFEVMETIPQEKPWKGHIHLAVAPTKMMDRVEWMVEKATELGVDELSFLDCRFSERRVVKTDRVERIVVAAMKQSRKAWKPVVNDMVPLAQFVKQQRPGACFIAHCYDEIPRTDLFHNLCQLTATAESGVTLLIGPEGDFSVDEVRMAVGLGCCPVSLGECRLRTETAAIAGVMMAQLALRKNTSQNRQPLDEP